MIPIAKPDLGPEEIEAVTEVLRSGMIAQGKVVAEFEERFTGPFEAVAKRRNGVAIAEARDGVCTICHVRLRPQVFNEVRRNDQIIQCDSCNRILYFVPASQPAGSTTGPAGA